MNNSISIKNLNKSYYTKKGQIKVLEDINFNIKKGEIVCLLGTSGCGKSTILSAIAGIDKDYEGKITTYNNKIGYMLQTDCLLPWLTIRENALLGLKLTKSLTNENITRVNNLLKKYNLYDFKDKYPSSLSGGMRQRVALIRTLATNPNILLLDEPFSALDYKTKIEITEDVYNIVKKENITLLLVTHNIEEAICISDKVIVLTNRPAKIKSIYNIKLENKDTPLNNRQDCNFNYYFKKIWNDLKNNE